MNAEAILKEFDREIATTRKLLERIPADKMDWKPHSKSTSMAGLGRHIAHLVGWAPLALKSSEVDVTARAPMPATETPVDIMRIFDKNVADTRSLLLDTTDEQLMSSWTVTRGGQPLLTQSKAEAIQLTIVHHIIHHRGQLSVYLRLNDIPVPSIYGPSADEGPS